MRRSLDINIYIYLHARIYVFVAHIYMCHRGREVSGAAEEGEEEHPWTIKRNGRSEAG